MTMRFSTLVLPKRHPEPSSRPCDDRVEASVRGQALAILVADGATGSGDGWKASGRMAESFLARWWEDPTAEGLAGLVREADGTILAENHGDADTTAVLAVVASGRVVGASAGDSQAFLVEGDRWIELTSAQSRKPRIGNGARPTTFEAALTPRSRLVIATDGLWQQAPTGEIRDAFGHAASPEEATSALAGLVASRARRGLPDDLGIVVVMP